MTQRFMFKDFMFVPTGKPKRVGKSRQRKARLGRVVEYGTSRTITLFVGMNKGKQPKNRTGRCRRKPKKFSLTAVDKAMATIRAAQVGGDAVEYTRVAGRGFYQGSGEQSVSYQVAFIPSTNEKSFAQFKRNMNNAAEQLAETFCQDSVLIVRDDGSKRSVASAEWDG